MTTALRNVSATQAQEAELSLDNAIASTDTSTSFVAQLNNASVAVSSTVVTSEVVVVAGDPDIQPSSVPSTITVAPVASNIGSSRITLTWNSPDDGGSAIVGYAVWFNSTHFQVENTQSTAPTFQIPSLLGETTYSFAVSAINSVGVGLASPFVTVSTNQQTAVPFVRGCDVTGSCTDSASCTSFYNSGQIMRTILPVRDSCTIRLSNAVDGSGAGSTTVATTFYYKVITDSATYYTEPIEPTGDFTNDPDGTDGW